MTNWLPTLSAEGGPRYLAIAEALAADVATGRLKPGDRLPTHRELAWQLKVTVGTVTRAYSEAERRGLIGGEVGRGTFVRDLADAAAKLPVPAESDLIDLSRNYPPEQPGDRSVADALAEIAQARIAPLLAYGPMRGPLPHREAGMRWVAGYGVDCTADHIAVTGSAQQGLMVALAAVARPGEAVLAEQLTFYGVKAIANLLAYRMHGVAIDRFGLVPDALEQACRQHAPKALYCVPNLHNPTAATMPAERRAEIAAICRRHGVTIVEDDSYGFLLDAAPPPIAAIAPDITIFVTSLSKPVAPGLRIGFLATRMKLIDRIETTMRATTWMATPLMGELAARLIRSGAAKRMADWRRDEARARQALAARVLAGATYDTDPSSYHLWLHLPEPWRREEFNEAARRRGVAVTPAEAFAVGRLPVPHAVRVCVSAAPDRARLETGLRIIKDLLDGASAPSEAMV